MQIFQLQTQRFIPMNATYITLWFVQYAFVHPNWQLFLILQFYFFGNIWESTKNKITTLITEIVKILESLNRNYMTKNILDKIGVI
jgi:hypothetical protein